MRLKAQGKPGITALLLFLCLSGSCCLFAAAAGGDDSLQCLTEIVFVEDFGSGLSNPGPPLPASAITYCFEDLSGSCPSNPGVTPGSIDDGSYSIMNDPRSGLIFASDDTVAWISIQDHTPGDTGGYMLVVNADFEPGEFYRLNDIPVFEGAEYSFSAWFVNILSAVSIQNCGSGQVPVNVNFIVEDAATGSVLNSFSTGNIFGSSDPEWEQTEFLFEPTSSLINIVLVNNAPGGCGNDFAIDDIQLFGCVANTTTAVDDRFEGCVTGGIRGNVLDNDMDDEGDSQAIVSILVDLDGDLIAETPAPTGAFAVVGGDAAGIGPVAEMGQLSVSADGAVIFVHEPLNLAGSVVFEYVVCDDGIPSVCDTGKAIIDITCVPKDTLDCVTEVFFLEDFGSGSLNPGPPLPSGTTTYCYEDLQGSCPSGSGVTPGSIDDGSYSIMNDPLTGIILTGGDTTNWISMDDHTPGDQDGYMLVVNADIEPGEFYRLNDVDVFAGEPYSFSAWFANILSSQSILNCGPDQSPVNVSFRVEDAVTGALLGSISSGDIFATGEEFWVRRSFNFIAGSDRINIVLDNNAPGGCGNDFAIDDIELFGCIANTTSAADDRFEVRQCDTLNGNVLDNDSDAEGHGQVVVIYLYDGDGDGVPESAGEPGTAGPVSGTDTMGGFVADAGTVAIDPQGMLAFFPDTSFSGEVLFSYVLCDDGIPTVCDTAGILIAVRPCPVEPPPPPGEEICAIPNLVSPNGDGLNDFFFLECAPVLPGLRVMVYNRWGNQVYDSGPGYDNSWDGTYGRKGQPLPEGVYYYIVEFNDPDNNKAAGDLIILR